MSEALAARRRRQGLQSGHAGGGRGARRRQPDARGRRGGGAGRAVGGGQVDAAAHRGAARRADRRAGAAARAGRPAGSTTRARTRLRRDAIGFVYQFHHLLPEFSALENVALPQRAAGAGRAAAEARARELLERGRARRTGSTTGRPSSRAASSSGWRSRGRSPTGRGCCSPTSRPATSIPETSARVFDVLLDLVRDTGLAALIATHNPELAARMDRVLRTA